MRLAFAGTPPFAAAALSALVKAGHDIALVLTQPDRPSGRGMKLKASAVKEVALSHGLTVLTPKTLSVTKDPVGADDALKALENCGAQVLVVAAYGLILPQRALDAAQGIGVDGALRSINIHGSLLPRWRGAAPVQRAMLAGDAKTGITLMKMEKGLDTGPMICTRELAITPEDTGGILMDKLADLGAEMIVEALKHPDQLRYEAQPEEGVTYAHKLEKSESPIEWSADAHQVARHIMAFNPFPSSTAKYGDEIVKVWNARAVEGSGRPGEILAVGDELVVACGSGAVACSRLQRAGRPAVGAHAFIQSCGLKVGEVLS